MQLQNILDRALEGQAPTRDEMVQLLQHSEFSLEAGQLRAVANHISRKRLDNHAFISGQIGYSTAPCSGDCIFCVFAAGHSTFPVTEMSVDEVVSHARKFAHNELLGNLFLMSMHNFDLDRFIELLRAVREALPPPIVITSNVGNLTLEQAKRLKKEGLNSAYQTVRLREGIDTKLDREERIQSVRNIQDAGLSWGFCCEPIGPEHTPEELADHILFGMSLKPGSMGAMRRVYLPNSPIANRGQITLLRLAQITAVVSLAALADPEIRLIGSHEPSVIGLTSGANNGCAESGANPRDESVETTGKRGLTVDDLARMIYEAGFDGVLRADGSRVSLKNYYQNCQ
jgi:biotin synthase